VAEAVRARDLIALPGWVAPRAEPVAPAVRVELPPPPPVRVQRRKEATHTDAEPTIRLVNLESRHFVPGKESVRISYAIDGPLDKVKDVHLLVKSRQPSNASARLPVPGPYLAHGEMLWEGRLAPAEALIQLAQSPYEVRFELVSRSGHDSTSDSAEIQLEIHSISIRVDDLGPLQVRESHRESVRRLALELEGAGMPGDCAGRVILDAPVFPVATEEMSRHVSATAYRAAVGDGVDVPLLASVRLKSKAGKGRRAPGVLRDTRLLWQFSYPSGEEYQHELEGRGAVANQRRFLANVAQHDSEGALPSGTGLHHALGGRRGLNKGPAVFWKVPLGSNAREKPDRPSEVLVDCGDGTSHVDSGVYFMSGPLAGETHRLRVSAPAFPSHASFDLKAPSPPVIRSNTISLTNWRRVPVAGDWFVGADGAFQEPVDLRPLTKELAPAAVLLERAHGVVSSNAGRHWRREHARVAKQAIKEGWWFFANSLEVDSQDDAVRFRTFAEYQKAEGVDGGVGRQLRRFRNYLSAHNERAYQRKCEERYDVVFDIIAETFPLPSHGLTLLKFPADHPHNQNPSKTSRIGGFFTVVKGRSMRDRTIVFLFGRETLWDTTVHEIGHSLFLEHQPGHKPGLDEPIECQPSAHDSTMACLMSYLGGQHFCGLCLLKLAGSNYWKIKSDGRVED
jgi:hypothetical protein